MLVYFFDHKILLKEIKGEKIVIYISTIDAIVN